MEGPNNLSALISPKDEEYEEVTMELKPEKGEHKVLVDSMLVGEILTEKSLNRGAVKTIITKAWGNLNGLKITNLGPNLFLFTFKNKEMMQEVMKKGPWFNLNHMLSLQKWKQEVPVTEVDFKWVPFWVKLHGLPLGVMTEKNASKIAEQIGQPLEVEDSRVERYIMRGFIRVRVLVNVQKPLLTGCWIPRENLPRVWVVFKNMRSFKAFATTVAYWAMNR